MTCPPFGRVLERVVDEAEEHLHDAVAVAHDVDVPVGQRHRERDVAALGERVHHGGHLAEHLGDGQRLLVEHHGARLELSEREHVLDEPAEPVHLELTVFRKSSRTSGSSFAPPLSSSSRPLSAAIGVRISWLAFATNRRCASSSRFCSVTSDRSSTAPCGLAVLAGDRRAVQQHGALAEGRDAGDRLAAQAAIHRVEAVLLAAHAIRREPPTASARVGTPSRRRRLGVDDAHDALGVERDDALGHRLDDRGDLLLALAQRRERLAELHRHLVVGLGELVDLVGDKARGEALVEVACGDRRRGLRHHPHASPDELREPHAEQARDDQRDPERDPQPAAHGVEHGERGVDRLREHDAAGAALVLVVDRLARDGEAARLQRHARVRAASRRGPRAAPRAAPPARTRGVDRVDERAVAVVDPDVVAVDEPELADLLAHARTALDGEGELGGDLRGQRGGVAELLPLAHLLQRALQPLGQRTRQDQDRHDDDDDEQLGLPQADRGPAPCPLGGAMPGGPLGLSEPVAEASDGEQVLGVLGVDLELLAHVVDVHVDRALVADRRLVPQRAQDRGPRVRLAGMLRRAA